jgi:hypothetical protein
MTVNIDGFVKYNTRQPQVSNSNEDNKKKYQITQNY